MAFIQNLASVQLGTGQEITLAHCRYVIGHYDDHAYAKHGVAFPEALRDAVIKRKAEHLAGRYLARLLLQPHSLPLSLATGQHRQPLWPAGWSGSITHSAGLAAVVLAPSATVSALGVDLESWISADVAERLAGSTLQPREMGLLCSGLPYAKAFTLGFSAKESVFKALYPAVGSYFNFDAVELVALDQARQCLVLQTTTALSTQVGEGLHVRVWFHAWQAGVLTLCTGTAAGAFTLDGCAQLLQVPCGASAPATVHNS